MVNWEELEKRFAARLALGRRPVAVTFLDAEPSGVAKFSGVVEAWVDQALAEQIHLFFFFLLLFLFLRLELRVGDHFQRHAEPVPAAIEAGILLPVKRMKP